MRSVHKLGQKTAWQVIAASGLVEAETLSEVVNEHHTSGERVTDILIARDLVTEFDVAKAMTKHLLLPFVSPLSYELNEEIKEMIPVDILHAHRILPLDRFGDLLVVATCGDLNVSIIPQIERDTRCRLSFYLAQRSHIERVLNEKFPFEGLGEQVATRLDELFGG